MKIPVCVLAAAVLSALANSAGAAQDITKRVAVAPDVTVDVSNVQGSVVVTAWERNEVELVAHLESDKDELEFEGTERQVRIEVDRPGQKYGHDDEEADLTLRVPAGARMVVGTVSADIQVAGVHGEQRLKTVSGEIETQAFDAPVSVGSVSGDITLAGSGGKAVARTENVSGATTVSGVRGSYEGQVVSGTIEAEVAAAEKLRVESVSGDLDVRAGLGAAASVEMNSISGTITLTLKPPVSAEFDIQSFSGDIENCFGPEPRDKSKYSPGSELNFTQGDGGARVDIETLSGEIVLCDR
jgi:DUF4097 and DUF4098 domain-containing protein YvlB